LTQQAAFDEPVAPSASWSGATWRTGTEAHRDGADVVNMSIGAALVS